MAEARPCPLSGPLPHAPPPPQVGGLGTAEEPYLVDDHWVFERLVAEDGQWQIKHRLPPPRAANAKGTSARSSASGHRGPRK